MTYLEFHLYLIVPPLLALVATLGMPLRRLGKPFWYLPALALIALLYTTPWDNYLVWRGVWHYGADRVIGTIAYVPLEEYAFFVLQPLLTGAWLYHVLARWSGSPSLDRRRFRSAGVLVYGAASVGGALLLATGSGLYVGAGCGAGPRDGLMTALARRGVPVVTARSGVESTALFGGWLLGGRIGLGTLVFTLGIGPLVHVLLPHLALDDRYRSPGRERSAWPSVTGQTSTETPRVPAAADGPRHPARARTAQ